MAAVQAPYRSVTVDGAGHSPACSRLSASPPRRRACARPVVGGRRSAVARSPCAHRFANPLPCPVRRDRAGMAAFAIRVGVALTVPWRGGRSAAATHSPVARLYRACLIAGRIVEIRLDGCFCASQPTSDLRDPETLLVAVVAGELRRTAPFRDTVEHTNRSLPDVLDSRRKRKKDPSGEEFPLLVLRLVRARIALSSARAPGGIGHGAAPPSAEAGVGRAGCP